MRALGKRVFPKGNRGFESLPLRQFFTWGRPFGLMTGGFPEKHLARPTLVTTFGADSVLTT